MSALFFPRQMVLTSLAELLGTIVGYLIGDVVRTGRIFLALGRAIAPVARFAISDLLALPLQISYVVSKRYRREANRAIRAEARAKLSALRTRILDRLIP